MKACSFRFTQLNEKKVCIPKKAGYFFDFRQRRRAGLVQED